MGSEDNRFYAFTSGGLFSWSYSTGNEVYSSPVLGSDGRVYVGSADNRLYCIKQGPTPTITPTPGEPTATPTRTPTWNPSVPTPTVTVTPKGPTPTPPIDLTANKMTFGTTDAISVTANIWPLTMPCYPFVRIVMADGSTLWYESGKGFMPPPVPYLGFAAGPITTSSPIPGYPALTANFSGIATGTYYLEGGAVDATKTTSAENLVYFGTVDRESLTVR